MAKKKPAGSSSPPREQPGAPAASEHPESKHPSREVLRRFMRGEATAAEGAEIVSHLIAGCRHCREVTRGVWLRARGTPSDPSAGPEIHPSSYAGIWKRSRRTRKLQEQLMEADRHEARRLCRELIDLPARDRLPLVCSDDRFRSFHLVKLLVEEGLWRRMRNPRQSMELAEVALAVAERLDVRSFGETALRDLDAAAWAALATAHRRAGDLDAAERALRVAEVLLREGSGDPLERARLLLLKAALRRDQRRLDEARALVQRAEAAHAGLGNRPLLGHIRIERSRIEARAGRIVEAVESLRQGLDLLDPERDAQVAFDARVELGHRLLDLGNTTEAVQQLWAAQRRAPEEARERLELDRLQARVALARGQAHRAEEMLKKVRRAWLSLGAGDDAARVTLDLARLYLREDPGKLRGLGEEIQGLDPWPGTTLNGRASLDVLRWATRDAEPRATLIAYLSDHLERSRRAGW